MNILFDRTINRRQLFGRIGKGIAAIPAVYFVAAFARPFVPGSEWVPSDLVLPESTKGHPWEISLTQAGEPGEAMVVSGRVYGADGRTPRAGVRVFAYHTDNRGFYAPDGNVMPPRLHGTMWTNAAGRYQFRSIRPAPYPGRAIPAHVHIFLFLLNGRRVNPDELQFEGDPFLKPEDISRNAGKETFSMIRPLVRANDGVLHCVRDFRLPGE